MIRIPFDCLIAFAFTPFRIGFKVTCMAVRGFGLVMLTITSSIIRSMVILFYLSLKPLIWAYYIRMGENQS